MGYSIMAKFKSEKKRNEILSFLEKELTPINKLVNDEILWVRGPTDDPAYGKNGYLIGFDFHLSDDLQSKIAYLICYWIKKQIPNCCLYYDGIKKIEIPEQCDKYGFHSLARLEYLRLEYAKSIFVKKIIKKEIKDLEKHNITIRNELKRLTNLWINK